MKTQVYILDENSLKLILPEVNNNISSALIKSSLINAHNYLQSVLGYTFYNEIITEVSGGTISTDNQYILDEYIYYIIAYKTLSHIIIKTSFQLENTGVRSKISTGSDIADFKTVAYLKEQAEQDLNNYLIELLKYLNAYATPTKYAAWLHKSSAEKRPENRSKPQYNIAVSTNNKKHYTAHDDFYYQIYGYKNTNEI